MRSVAGCVLGVLAVLGVLVALALGACTASPPGAPSDTAAVSGSVHNADDVAFLQDMIPHHEQALDLSEMVSTHTDNAQLIALAQRIADAQRSEIHGFRAQLMQWEEPLGDPHGMDGMVDPSTMDRLKALNGPAFDELWLHSMIAHHQGAITMAHNEIAHGHSPSIIALAKSIATSQQAEVDQMKQMLGVQ